MNVRASDVASKAPYIVSETMRTLNSLKAMVKKVSVFKCLAISLQKAQFGLSAYAEARARFSDRDERLSDPMLSSARTEVQAINIEE